MRRSAIIPFRQAYLTRGSRLETDYTVVSASLIRSLMPSIDPTKERLAASGAP
jgi:hypothetical protein